MDVTRFTNFPFGNLEKPVFGFFETPIWAKGAGFYGFA